MVHREHAVEKNSCSKQKKLQQIIQLLQIIINNKHDTVPGVQDILYYQNIYELTSFKRHNINMHNANSVSVTLHMLLAAVNSY